ncbi:MAG: aminoacyl-tRNA hydrolase [Methylophilus sp.]|jgi:peptidyl-tRNA hydrolase
MKTAMYIFINKGLGMSAGKVGSQAAHAAVEAFRISKVDKLADWYKGKHYMKLVMQARDGEHLQNIQDYLSARGFKSEMIIDEGLTEIDSIVKTALGVEVVDKEDPHTEATFGSFELYRDSIKVTLEIPR